MGKKISKEVIKKIVVLFDTKKSDSEIAEELKVSSSYVNKLRNAQIRKETKESEDIETKYVVVPDAEAIDEIELLELKISSMEQTLIWYKELLNFKKK